MATVKDRDEESGRYRETYPPEVFVEALAALGGSGTTREVEAEVGKDCSYRTTHAKLSTLADEGRVEKRKVGNAILWSLADEEDV